MPDIPTPVTGSHNGPPLVCLGASVRALACSATRAGWRVHAADLFGDRDLRDCVASYTPVGGPAEPYPEGLGDAITRLPDGPWCYTGALENHPDLIDRIAATRSLAGNPGRVLRLVRDPTVLGPAVREAGLAFPETFPTPDGLPTDGSFLRKPRASAGGRGIAAWHGGPPEPSTDDHVWQRSVPGASWSVALVCDRLGARPWVVSRQLVGCHWCHAGRFAYCGSIEVPDPILPDALRNARGRLGSVLAGDFGVVGLVGCDLVVDGGQRVHVIEVNPRPTASMELADRARGVSHAAAHLAACELASPATPTNVRRVSGIWGKAVLFAAHDVCVDVRVEQAIAKANDRWTRADGWPAVADVPVGGTSIAARRPLVTLFAHAADARGVRRALRRRAAILTRAFSAGEPTRL